MRIFKESGLEHSYRAVVIENIHTVVAILAVPGSVWPPNIAYTTEIGLQNHRISSNCICFIFMFALKVLPR